MSCPPGTETYRVAAFYRFVDFGDFAAWQSPLQGVAAAGGVTGSILLASEGVNGNIAGPPAGVQAVVDLLVADPRLADMAVMDSWSTEPPFGRLKVRLKAEIVPLGTEVQAAQTGTRVRPEQWNELLEDPDVVVIDVRNDYEIAVGGFPGAVNPHTSTYREFAAWAAGNRDLAAAPKVAMYCTGGIRCEKAGAYLRSLGVADVYQLEGGILNYLDSIPETASRWEGECYVFDRRVTVDASLRATGKEVCVSCNRVLGEADLSRPGYVRGVTCDACHATTSADRRRRFQERQRQFDRADENAAASSR